MNGVLTNVTTDSSTNWAAPVAMPGGSLPSQTMSWNAALAPTQVSGLNSDSTLFGYDTNARPTSTTSPIGATIYHTCVGSGRTLTVSAPDYAYAAGATPDATHGSKTTYLYQGNISARKEATLVNAASARPAPASKLCSVQ